MARKSSAQSKRKNAQSRPAVGEDRSLPPAESSPIEAAAAESVQSGSAQPEGPSRTLPRPERRPRRAKVDRGLPPDEELARLSAAYLERQRMHWKTLVELGLLPEADPDIVAAMVESFKRRHRTGLADVEQVLPFVRQGLKLAGNYDRYSCDNSSPLSIVDQMVNALDKARSEDRFVPWEYVFADYSVTGLDPGRQGYTSYKTVLADERHFIETTYIDDFSRASRDELEWWKLAALSKRLRKRMIGASDGFDVGSPDWDIRITIYGLVSRLFVKGLREKVRRGMRGAARRGTCLGKLPLGFTRGVLRDEQGDPVLGADGQPIHDVAVDPETSGHRRLLFELFVDQGLTPDEITRQFNQLKVDGWNGWTERAVKKLLWSPTAIGVFLWNRTRREYDWEAGQWVVVRNPRSEWEVRYDPRLAIVPLEKWRAARRLLAERRRASPLTGRKPSRNEVCATTLFSGALFCADCGEELKLIRSTPKYKQIGCLNGIHHARGCSLSTSKSVRIVEECLLGFLHDVLLGGPQVDALVAASNRRLEELACEPEVDTAPLKADVRTLEAKIRKLVLLVENEPDEDLCRGYDRRIRELQKELNDRQASLRKAADRTRRPPVPLTKERVVAYLDDLRGTLSQEIPVAARAIRNVTGPIRVRQEPVPDREGKFRWVATFRPDLASALRAAVNGDGTSGPTIVPDAEVSEEIVLPIEKIPRYERLAPLFKQLHDGGSSIDSLAAAYGMTWKSANEIVVFADTGRRPEWTAGKRTGTKCGHEADYRRIAAQVVAMREDQRMSFEKIAEELGVARNTARRAYDHLRPKAAIRAAEEGTRPQRGTYSHLGEKVIAEIRRRLHQGEKTADIAAQVGCGKSTVDRVRQSLRSQQNADETGPSGDGTDRGSDASATS